MNLHNSILVPSGLRCCYWHPDYVSECQVFLIEKKPHTEQLNNPEFIGMNSDQLFIESGFEARAAAASPLGMEGGEAESPHTITSGLLYHGDTNHD